MTTPIDSTRTTSPRAFELHEDEQSLVAQARSFGGGAEEILAMAMVMADRQAESRREARREARALKREAVADQVDTMRRAADTKLVGAIGSAAFGVAGAMSECDETQQGLAAGSKLLEGSIARSVGHLEAQQTEIAAVAEEHRENAQDIGEDEDRAEQAVDRAIDRIAQIADARAQARLAAARG